MKNKKNRAKNEKEKVKNDFDYISSNKYNFSLMEFCESNPKGSTDKVIASLLCMTEDEVKEIYNNVIIKVRNILDIEVND